MLLSTLLKLLPLLINISPEAYKYPYGPEYDLKDELFQRRKYNKEVRPKINLNSPIRLNISLSAVQLLDLSVKNEKIELMTWMYMHWFDEYLTWNPKKFGGITSTVVSAEMVWKPDFYLYNSVHSTKWNARINTPLKLSYTGQIDWSSPATFSGACDVNSEYYPFDTQNCSLWFGTWTHTSDQLDPYRMEKWFRLLKIFSTKIFTFSFFAKICQIT